MIPSNEPTFEAEADALRKTLEYSNRTKKLTNKQELAIQYHLQGDSKTEAVMKAYDCKKRDTAKSLASKLFKIKAVNDRLTEKLALVDNKTIDEFVDFRTQLKNAIPTSTILKSLQDAIAGKDERVKDSARKDWFKIIGVYHEKDNKVLDMFKDIKADNEREE